MTVRSKLISKISATIATAALVFTGLGSVQPANAVDFPPVVPMPSKVIDSTSVGMQMFMWNWVSLKSECTNVLGPEGVDWIWVSPPEESMRGNTWWTHYQPVSYNIASNLGTELQFREMVNACNTAGVKVVVDAVINHMTNGSGVGWGGTNYTKYNYPGLYGDSDFHNCRQDISDYSDPNNYQLCELLGLPDLATEKQTVRDAIAGYLTSLADMGVAGFRIDAAKHIAQADLDAIKAQVAQTHPDLFWVLEIYSGGQLATDYSSTGNVFAWESLGGYSNAFNAPGYVGLMSRESRYASYATASDKSVTMVTDHDTERNGEGLNYTYGKLYTLAHVALLGENWGKPMLYSGYAFSGNDDGPLYNLDDTVKNAACSTATTIKSSYKDGQYLCVQRWSAIKGMIAFHHFVGTAARTAAFTKARGVLGYGRSGLGYLLMNSNTKTYKATVSTGMAKGTYCDLITGGTNPIKTAGKKCVGASIVVNSKHQIYKYSVAGLNAFAITTASKLK